MIRNRIGCEIEVITTERLTAAEKQEIVQGAFDGSEKAAQAIQDRHNAAQPAPPWAVLPSFAAIRVQPGDVIHYTEPGELTEEEREAIEEFHRELFPNNGCIVSCGGAKAEVVRPVPPVAANAEVKHSE